MEDGIAWEKFLDRKGIKKSKAAQLIGAAPAMITEWMKGKSSPSYMYIKKLCLAGMTADELFGKEAAEALLKNSKSVESVPKDFSEADDFKKAVQDVFFELKKSGKI